MVQPGLVQFLQEAAVAVQMRATDSQQQPTRITEEIKRIQLSPNVEIAAETVNALICEGYDSLLEMSDYKVTVKTANCKVLH